MTTTAGAYAPPGGRTEHDVAAEVVVTLIEHGILPKNAQTLRDCATALHIPLAVIKTVWEYRDEFRRTRLSATPVRKGAPLKLVPIQLPEPQPQPAPAPVVSPTKGVYHPAARRANEAKKAKKEPEPGIRICSKCGRQPKSNFNVKDRKTGTLRSYCKDCEKKYKADRYLTSEQVKRLGDVLRFILDPGDAHEGVICPDCEKTCKAGEEVIATGAVLHHAEHFQDNV